MGKAGVSMCNNYNFQDKLNIHIFICFNLQKKSLFWCLNLHKWVVFKNKSTFASINVDLFLDIFLPLGIMKYANND